MPERLGIVTDAQYGPRADEDHSMGIVDGQLVPLSADEGGEQRFCQDAPRRLREVLEHLGEMGVYTTIHMGDLTDYNPDDTYLNTMLEICDQAPTDVLQVMGNHDYYEEGHNLLFPQADVVPARLGLSGRGYYGIDIGEAWRTVILNTNDAPWFRNGVSKAVQARLKQGLANNYPGNGAVGEVQVGWLEGQCEQAVNNGRNILVVGHHPLTSPRGYCLAGDVEPLQDVFEQYNVRAYFAGHDHLGQDLRTQGGVHHVVLPALFNGAGLWPHAVADLHPNGAIDITGYGGQPNLTLPS